MKKILWLVSFVAAAALSMWHLNAAGVTVSFLNPPAGNVYPAGLDYATDVLGDPWDMNSMNDIAINPVERAGWNSLGVNAGTGVPNAIGGQWNGGLGLQVLYEGLYGVINTHRNGRQFPISTSTFRRIAFKLKTANANIPLVWWDHRPAGDPLGRSFGGGGGFLNTTANAYAIGTVDLTAMPSPSGQSWTAQPNVAGLRIDPHPAAQTENVFFDWVRLTAADDQAGSAMQTVQWSGGTGTAVITITDSTNTTFTVPCAALTSSSCRWNYGILPPGAYQVTVTRGASNGTATFTVNAAPSVQVTSPSMTSGEDYATARQLNPWDMNDSADIDNDFIGSDHLPWKSWPGTEFAAASDGVCLVNCATQPTGDPQVYMLANNEANDRGSIDSSRYRYLTFNIQIDHAFDLFAGSVARVLYGHYATTMNGITPHYNLAVSEDILMWPGYNTYTIDMAALGLGFDQGMLPAPYSPAPLLWTDGAVRQLRIDPHEFAQIVTSHIADVKLTAMSEVAPGGTFQVNFSAADADAGDSVTVRLFRDTDKNTANGMTEITSSPLSGVSSFNWNTSGVPTGVYYIYARATDGLDTRGSYSNAPVKVAVPSNGPPEPYLAVDAPANGATVGSSFLLYGWAIDRGAGVGTGMDAVHVWAYPSGGGAGTFLGSATYGSARSDVGAYYGSQFTNSGYTLNVSGLANGTYQVIAFGHSTLTGTFSVQTIRTITVSTPVSQPRMALDSPGSSSTNGRNMVVSGWAVDLGAPTGTGVNKVDVWAFPTGGGAGTFLGSATYGLSRPDIGATFGNSRFTPSGFQLSAVAPPGNFTITAYMRSTLTGTFSSAVNATNVTVLSSYPLGSLDSPGPGTQTRPFGLWGWAVDMGATSGTGVNAVHVWAFPVAGGSPTFVGAAAYGQPRPDMGAYLGSSQFNNSGYGLVVNSTNLPAAGTYDLNVYARSTVTGAFNVIRIVRVTVF